MVISIHIRGMDKDTLVRLSHEWSRSSDRDVSTSLIETGPYKTLDKDPTDPPLPETHRQTAGPEAQRKPG